MPFADLNDLSLHYEIEGSGPPAVLISGMLSDSASWGPLVTPLSERYTVIRPDNRSTGRTTPELAPTSPMQSARDVLALMDHLGLERAHIVGHSMGGFIASELTFTAPERVQSLSLLCSTAENLPRNMYLFQTLCDVRATGPEGLWLRSLFPWLFHHDAFRDPKAIEAAVAASLSNPHAQSLQAMQHQLNSIKNYSPAPPAKTSTTPTLGILAQVDLILPLEEAKDQLSRRPNTRIAVIPKAGHSVHWDAPEPVLAALLPFLKENDHAT